MKGIDLTLIGDRPAFSSLLVHMEAGRIQSAKETALSLLARYPYHAEAMYHLAIIASSEENDKAQVAELMLEVTKLRPEWPDALYNAGFFHQRLGRKFLSLAEALYRRTLALEPTHAGALVNLGCILLGKGEVDAALTYYTKATYSKELSSLARYNRAMAFLLLGQWEQGWEDYEQRRLSPLFTANKPKAPCPVWNGVPQPGKTLVIDQDQGAGDVIMCLRWAERLSSMGMRVIWRVQPNLMRLVQAQGLEVVSDQESYPKGIDFDLPVMSLPHRMQARVASLDGSAYLAQQWTPQTLSRREAVGLVWSGNPSHENDLYRSLPVGAAADLIKRSPRTTWRSLQVGARTEEIPTLPSPSVTDFTDTARELDGMGLVVTVDTAIAHLCGAMGVPCWVMLPAFPDYRWMLQRSDTPWYRSVRLYRQTTIGEWDEVFTRIATDLEALA